VVKEEKHQGLKTALILFGMEMMMRGEVLLIFGLPEI
jgi:hypothetical protein